MYCSPPRSKSKQLLLKRVGQRSVGVVTREIHPGKCLSFCHNHRRCIPHARHVAMDQLSTRDKMLLTQTLYELGNDNWSSSAMFCAIIHSSTTALTLPHPPPHTESEIQMCQAFYKYLAQEMPQDTEGRDEFKAHSKPHAPFHLHLARKHYKARVVELRLAIIENEQTFK
ncbi:hypothetical protein BKA62DRAFT_673933 [Auriculariales sp. MPI-PUGE-AT-0066]|nr:hypothetical protein BKA62DRAFT_673933 [Auriculariales sp. MPI-PUGE-AT-0066]